MGDNQAQEGRAGCQARQDIHPPASRRSASPPRAAATLTAMPGCAPPILAAKAENMPQENIKRAIQRGTGELEGVNYEEITFEGYGPGGVAIIVDVHDRQPQPRGQRNPPRLLEERRQPGRVRLGPVPVREERASSPSRNPRPAEEQLMDIVLEHGGEDLKDEGDTWEILTDPASYEAVACRGEGRRHSHGDERSHHGRLHLYQAGRQRRPIR